MTDLYDECTTLNIVVEKFLEGDQWNNKCLVGKWMAVFQAADLPNMLKIVSYVLSIPASTGFVEMNIFQDEQQVE